MWWDLPAGRDLPVPGSNPEGTVKLGTIVLCSKTKARAHHRAKAECFSPTCHLQNQKEDGISFQIYDSKIKVSMVPQFLSWILSQQFGICSRMLRTLSSLPQKLWALLIVTCCNYASFYSVYLKTNNKIQCSESSMPFLNFTNDGLCSMSHT